MDLNHFRIVEITNDIHLLIKVIETPTHKPMDKIGKYEVISYSLI